jgi:uncharacterized membrane-anchored protein YhcB (DUF1043 family)
MDELPWKWILSGIAFVMAISSLVKLSIDRRDELQGKLEAYLEEQKSVIANKRKILAEHRRRASLAKRIALEKAKLEAQEAEAEASS